MAATEHLEASSSTSGASIDVKLVLASYPLKGPKDIRDQILLALPANVDVLFVVGDKDVMCPLGLLDEVRKKMAAKSKLVVVKGADHGMHGGGKTKEKKVGELTGLKAYDWMCGKMEQELVEITGEEDEDPS
jgi:dienelactone hydrolase